ncbi:unnamed protein product [Nippostrongylus brasiliensis]|uniref:Flavin-containing monooxygenase n=1 Tax=Nippostrongylus brasiliensis TaxID=27835 RepID=A0A0N4YGD3_NIPBR|nr:unnamed protein product [Nippostrongylus brasiliensis]
MVQKKKVAIVGAGASGLPSIRHGLLYGLDVTCFEASSYVGGLWRYREEETECKSKIAASANFLYFYIFRISLFLRRSQLEPETGHRAEVM